MEKVTIIIPVYNVEKYLKQCIDSIINQTYKNIELILINDGSTDSSKEICEEYNLQNTNIKLINQKNHDLGHARNRGLRASSGEYIMFVDSDDYLPIDAVYNMYSEIKSRNADVITANYINTDDSGKPWQKPIFDIEKFSDIKISIKDYNKSFYVMNSSVCNKIFKKEFLKKNNIKFEIEIPAEDAIFSMKCLNFSDDIYYINKVVYYYRQRDIKSKEQLSISNNCSLKYFKGISKAYKIIYNIFKNNNTISFYRYFYAKSTTYILSKFIDTTLLNNSERMAAIKELEWLYNLAPLLKVTMCNDKLEEIVEAINLKKYDEAILKCKILADIRKNMTQQELLNQSKPSFEFYKRISKYDNEFENKSEGEV